MELSDTLYNSGDHAAREISRYIVIENCRQSSNDKIASRASFIFASFGEKGAVEPLPYIVPYFRFIAPAISFIRPVSTIQPPWLAVATGRYAEARFLSSFGKKETVNGRAVGSKDKRTSIRDERKHREKTPPHLAYFRGARGMLVELIFTVRGSRKARQLPHVDGIHARLTYSCTTTIRMKI